jgi:hypothetical protein
VKKAIAIAGAVALAPTLLIAPVAVALAGSNSAQAACSADGAQAVDSTAVAKQVESILKGDGKGSVSVPGLDDPEEQIPNAETIQATGIAMKVPARGQIVALATALQESGLRNLDYGDRDSLGLFQQRPSQGWGTAAEVRDPVHASTKFYEGLLKVSGWQSMTVAQAAQAVQNVMSRRFLSRDGAGQGCALADVPDDAGYTGPGRAGSPLSALDVIVHAGQVVCGRARVRRKARMMMSAQGQVSGSFRRRFRWPRTRRAGTWRTR